MRFRFNNQPTDLLVKSTKGLRMSTSAAGIAIGIVSSLVLAILILTFAIYKMRHKAVIEQYGVSLEEQKFPLTNKASVSTQNTKTDFTYNQKIDLDVQKNQLGGSLGSRNSTPRHQKQPNQGHLSATGEKLHGVSKNGSLVKQIQQNHSGMTSNHNNISSSTNSNHTNHNHSLSFAVPEMNHQKDAKPLKSILSNNHSNFRTNSTVTTMTHESPTSCTTSEPGGSSLDIPSNLTRKPSYSQLTGGQVIDITDLSHLKEWYV